MLMRAESACLVIVDAQERLVPAIKGAQTALKRISALIQGARRLGVPVLASEHCPESLGATAAPINRRFATCSPW